MIHVHSCYDILHSTIRIEELVKKCKESGMKYAAVCDRNLSSWPHLIKCCSEEKIKPILGYESHDEGWYFFALNKKGYYEIIKYRNRLLTVDFMLMSENLIKITDNVNLLESVSFNGNIYFGVDEKTDSVILAELSEEMPLIYFREVCFLGENESIAIDMMDEIGKKDVKNLSYLIFDDSEKNIVESKYIESAISNVLSVIDLVEEFNLKADFALLKVCGNEESGEKLKELLFKSFEGSAFYEKAEYVERLHQELDVIIKKGFSDYLLLAKTIVDKAKEINAAVGPGRGSSVGSLIANILGITLPDPVKNKLIFERFISMDRDDFPDIDIDVEDRMRQALIASLREEYGEFRVVHIGTFGTFGERLAAREIAKKKMVSLKEVENGSFLDLKHLILGLPHHKSIHAAGIILSEKDLRELIPLYESSPGIYVTEYDMDSLSSCGIVKMDILGLSTLSVLKDIYDEDGRLDSERFRYQAYENDESVYRAFEPNNCSGIFQLDSRSGRNLLSKTKPGKFEDIAVLISLNRPGPGQSGLTDEYIMRKENDKKIVYAHPSIKEILKDTFGVPIFQEQVMEIAMKLADFSPRQANDLRKAMAKKDPDKLVPMKQTFIEGMMRHNIDEQTADRMYKEILEFAGYAFNKAHATAYAMITYSLMYAKVHVPMMFYRSLISHNAGKSDKLFELICEARKNGVKVEKADINRSFENASVADDKIIMGLNSIREIGPNTCERIIQSRNAKPFGSVEDLLSRIDHSVLSDRTLAVLYDSGALDSILCGMDTISEILSVRDRTKNDLKMIMDVVFDGKKEEERKIETGIRNTKEKDILNIIQNNIRSYGFLMMYEQVFGICYPPFGIDAEFKLAVITSIISLGSKYLAFDGVETHEISEKKIVLNLGVKILMHRMGRKYSLAGIFSDNNKLRLTSRIFRKLNSQIHSEINSIKGAGVDILEIVDNKNTLEVEI